MAEVIRYVDPDVSGGEADGTSWANAYASMHIWDEAEKTDLVSDGDWHHVYCRSSSGTADTTGVFLSGWTTSATCYVLIESADDHEGAWDTSKYRLVDASGHALVVYGPNFHLKGLQVQAEDGNALASAASGAGFLYVENCILKGSSTATTNKHICGIEGPGGTGSTVKMWNNIIMDGPDRYYAGIYINEANADFYIENNTFVNIETAMRHNNSNSHHIRNNHIDAESDAFYGTFTDDDDNNDYNVTNLGTHVALGSHGAYGATFTYTASGSGDYSPGSDSDSVDAGEDGSSGNIGFSADILGTTRSGTWDVGAFEYASASTAYTIDADAGTYTFTGSDATLTYAANDSIEAESGSFTLTGTDAGLLKGYAVDAEAGAFTLTGSDIGFGEYTIIDHESVALFDLIPDEYITEVKKKLLIVPGASHSTAYGYGLANVEALDSDFDSRVTWTGAPESYREDGLRYNHAYRYSGTWNTNTGEEEIYTNATARGYTQTGLEYMEDNYTGDIHFGFGWCWDMTWINGATATKDSVYGCGWAGSSVDGPDGNLAWGLDSGDSTITGNSVCMDTYLDAFDDYIADAPGVKSFFTTGPVDGNNNNELGWQRYLKHEHIRSHVKAVGGTLFDWADLLSWNYTTEAEIENSWTDGASVEHTWPGGNTSYAGSYDGGEGNCHLTSDACTVLGKALWVMLAMDAGWDGTAVVDAEAGSYTLTGSDAGLYKGFAIDAGAGAYTFTGSDATLTYATANSVEAESGTFTETGADADLLKTWLLSAESGAFVETGTDAALNYGLALNAETGAFVLTGADADFLRTWLISAEAGAIAYTGNDVTLTYAAEFIPIDRRDVIAWVSQRRAVTSKVTQRYSMEAKLGG